MGKVDLQTMTISGTIGDMVYFTRGGKQFVRRSPVYDKQKFLTDPKMEHVRNSSMEFKILTEFSKMMYDSVKPTIRECKDSRTYNRLNSLLSTIRNRDLTSERGFRSPKLGLAQEMGKALLKGFDFNDNFKLNQLMWLNYQIDTSNGVLIFKDFTPQLFMNIKKEHTHFAMTLSRVAYNFNTDEHKTTFGTTYIGNRKDGPCDITLQLEDHPCESDLQIFIFKLGFMTEYNGSMFPTTENSFLSCNIIAVL